MKFIVKVSSYKEDKEENLEKFKEDYLVEAENFTDAEAKTTKEVLPFIARGCEINIQAAAKKEIDEVFDEDGSGKENIFFFAKYAILIEDEKGRVKATNSSNYIVADDFQEAASIFQKKMKEATCNVVELELKRTKILDYIK